MRGGYQSKLSGWAHIRCAAGVLFLFWYLLTSSGVSLLQTQIFNSSVEQTLSGRTFNHSKEAKDCNCGHDGSCSSSCRCQFNDGSDTEGTEGSKLFSCTETPPSPDGITSSVSLQWQHLFTSAVRPGTRTIYVVPFGEYVYQFIRSTPPDKVPKFG